MPRVSTALLLVCWVVSAIPAQEIALRADCGGWKPGPELRARAVALKGLDANQLEAAAKGLEGEGGAALRIRICRAGLRLADDGAALACATRLEWDELDPWEIERVVALCLKDNEYARPGTVVDFLRFRAMVGGPDLERIFRSFPSGPWSEPPEGMLEEFHRQCTAEHIPVLVRLCTRSEAQIRKVAWENIRRVALNTDRHLELVLRTSLTVRGIPIATGPERALRPDEWTRSLRTIVFHVWPQGRGTIDPIERRAVLTRRSLPEDEAALRGLVERSLVEGRKEPLGARWDLLLRALRHHRSPETLALLSRVASADTRDRGEDWAPERIALAALAAHGDAEARVALAAKAASFDDALALLFEVDSRAAAAIFERQLLGGSDTEAERALERRCSANEIRHALLLSWPKEPYIGLASRAAASRLGGLALLGIANELPGCVTRQLVGAAIERLQSHEIRQAAAKDYGEDTVLARLAVAEACAPERLKARLRLWAKGPDPVVRRIALLALLKVGDPESGPQLAAWVDEELELPTGFSDDILVFLARSPCPEVGARLREAAREQLADPDPEAPAFIGLAVLQEIPRDTAEWVSNEPRTKEERRALCREILEGRAEAAFRAWMKTGTGVPDDIWRLDRADVRAYLERLRREREHECYAFATATLARMGDAAARAEALSIFRAGRFFWFDLIDQGQAWALLDEDLRRIVPLWIACLETNCCRIGRGHDVLGELFDGVCGLNLDDTRDGWDTRASVMRRWWLQHRSATFVWSRLAEKFIPIMPD